MKPLKWIEKNCNCDVTIIKAKKIFEQSILLYEMGDNETKKMYIKQVKDNLKNSDLYAEFYTLSAKAFIKYYSL